MSELLYLVATVHKREYLSMVLKAEMLSSLAGYIREITFQSSPVLPLRCSIESTSQIPVFYRGRSFNLYNALARKNDSVMVAISRAISPLRHLLQGLPFSRPPQWHCCVRLRHPLPHLKQLLLHSFQTPIHLNPRPPFIQLEPIFPLRSRKDDSVRSCII